MWKARCFVQDGVRDVVLRLGARLGDVAISRLSQFLTFSDVGRYPELDSMIIRKLVSQL